MPITIATWNNKQFILGELYMRVSYVTNSIVYRLTKLEPVVMGHPGQTHRFYFSPVADLRPRIPSLKDLNTYITAEPYGMELVTLVNLAGTRMALDDFIIKEAKRRGDG